MSGTFIFIWLAFGVVTALAAMGRGRNPWAWLAIGCLFGIFGLIAVLVMGDPDKNA
jgi:glycerol uptake facilitator-like aquaporin